ncbi:MAG: ribosome maturation factor RimM [Bacilli bacterium]|nr:ribosome maturation factor RimM [Bacilli bacterium]
MEYLLLGKISKPHGLKGEVKIFSNTDFAHLRYQKGNVVFLLSDNKYIPLKVHSFYKYKEFDVVSFEDHLNINLVNDLLGKNLYIKKEDATLPKNHYHYSDLVNLKVINENKEIGIVKNVIHAPANDILRCETSNHQKFDIPFVNEFIISVNLDKKEIKVKLIEGIL